MTFSTHVDELRKKTIGTLLHLNRISDRLDNDCRVMVVQSLVMGVLNYCLKVWGSANKTQLRKVKKLQNFAARIAIGGARKHDHVSPIYRKLKWLHIDEKYHYDISILTFKIVNKMLPEWLFNLPTVEETRQVGVNTRQQNLLYIPRTITDMGARALNVTCPTFWNRLPLYIRTSQTISSFKSKLKSFLLDVWFNSKCFKSFLPITIL